MQLPATSVPLSRGPPKARPRQCQALHLIVADFEWVKQPILDFYEANVVFPHSDRCPRFQRGFVCWWNDPWKPWPLGWSSARKLLLPRRVRARTPFWKRESPTSSLKNPVPAAVSFSLRKTKSTPRTQSRRDLEVVSVGINSLATLSTLCRTAER
jgi:hypothetical protein